MPIGIFVSIGANLLVLTIHLIQAAIIPGKEGKEEDRSAAYIIVSVQYKEMELQDSHMDKNKQMESTVDDQLETDCLTNFDIDGKHIENRLEISVTLAEFQDT